MQPSSQELATLLRSVINKTADAIAARLIGDQQNFSSYANMPYNVAWERAHVGLTDVINAIEKDDPRGMLDKLEQRSRTRIKANYDPNGILRSMDVVAEELIKAALSLRPDDKEFSEYVKRRINMLNQATKFSIVRLNMSIPVNERVEIDPDLLK